MVVVRLSSPFGGDSRDARSANLLLTGGFSTGCATVESCALLRGVRPCPFRWPSMAGGRPPLAEHRAPPQAQGTQQARTHRHKPPAHGHNPILSPMPSAPDLAACDGRRLRLLAANGQRQAASTNSPGSRQAPDSPPNGEESRLLQGVASLRSPRSRERYRPAVPARAPGV
jgi:hypothetical protein